MKVFINLWEALVPMPEDDKVYTWDEENISWVKVKLKEQVGG